MKEELFGNAAGPDKSAPGKELRILVADDHETVREGARVLIERVAGWIVCGVAETGRQAVELAEKLQPHIVIMDINMPDLNGIDAARQIKRRAPQVEILMFTGHDTDEIIRKAFDIGVKSFIHKSQASSHLLDAIRSLAEHKPFFTSKVSEVLFARFLDRCEGKASQDQGTERLSAREREIVQLIAEGMSNKEVAAKLTISVKTVETHRAAILRKLRIDSLADLVRYAIRNNIVEA
jgi:DNA-binding NarL/FixJ family response regulator